MIKGNNKFIFLILLVAIFTVFSYGFDQKVISDEDKIRNLRIKYENQITELSTLQSIEDQLEDISTFSTLIVSNFLTYRNYQFKRFLLNTDYKLGMKENLDYLINPKRDLISIKDEIIRTYIRIMMESLNIKNKLDEVYSWNDEYFKKYEVIQNNINYYAGMNSNYSNLDEIFNENIKLFNIKDYNFYLGDLFSLYGSENQIQIYRNYTLENWQDIHKLSILLIKNIDDNQSEIRDNITFIYNNTVKLEEKIELSINNLKKVSSRKNLFILSGIFSQIISLLFLLILFRFLLLKSNLKTKKKTRSI
jgi:hypothetical protein